MHESIALATSAPEYSSVKILYERQVVTIGGPDDGGDSDDAGATPASYNNGMYTPSEPAATSIVAGEVYSSLEVNSLTTESLDEAATTTTAVLSSSNLISTSSIASTAPSSTASNSAPSSLASTMASTSKSASSSSASSKSTNSSNLASNNTGGPKFHLTYLIPLFAIVGLVLLCVIAGKIWGRIAYSKERAIRRNGRLERQLLKEQRREKKERAERIRQQWEQNGWGETMSPDASFEKQHPDQAYDSDFSEDELKGPLSAIGTHLAGVKQGRAPPPASRVEQGRYGGKVEANNWLEVKWKRNFGQAEQSVHNCLDPGAIDTATSPSLRATLRGTWERVKLKITENIGWGYDGNTPDFSQRRQIIADASNNHLWTRVPLGTADAPHTQGGLLYPPQLGEDGLPFVPPPAQPRRYFFPLAARHREGSFSPPEMKAPPNTIKPLSTSPSKTALAGVKELFTGYRSRSNQSFTDSTGRGKHKRLHDEVDDHRQGLAGHVHTDGSRCTLTEPQYLPPPAALQSKYDQVDRYSLYDGPQQPHGADTLNSTPSRCTASVQRKATQLETSQIVRARSTSARKRQEEEEDGDRFTRRPTSIMRNKTKSSMPISRSSTVRFNDVGDSSAASILLGYSTSNYDQSDEENEDQVSPTKRLSRAKTTLVRKSEEKKTIRMYKSMGDGALASAYRQENDKIDRKRTESRKQPSSGQRSYTDAVNFGDEDDRESEEMPRMGNFPTLDSRILSKAKKARDESNSPKRTAIERLEPKEEVVMDLSRTNLTRGSGSRLKMPGLTHASSAEEDEELMSDGDVESEIDSALLTLIARSNTSKSNYLPFPDINTPKQGVQDSPGFNSPGRKKAWREKNGKWERSAEDEMEYVEPTTPSKAFSSTASPPPLPTPPLFGVKQSSTSPTRSGTALPPSLSIALGPERPQHSSASRGGRANLFIRPPTLRDVTGRPISPVKRNPVKSPSVYSVYSQDEEQEQEKDPSNLPIRSTVSVRSNQSVQSYDSNGSTSTSSTSPQRRLAMAKRTAAARPPRRYQAKLGGGDDENDQDQTTTPMGSRLHTGKSFRTPAEKDRERQFAMDRVQSIVIKGHAKRQQSF